MAVSPINVSRISQNLRLNMTLESLQRNQRDLFLDQVRISAGRSFVTPSEDPAAALQTFNFTNLEAHQNQIAENVQLGGSILRETDNAIVEVNDLLLQAQTVASMTISNLTSAEERQAEAEVVAAIRQQLIVVGNRTFNRRYIFAGHETLTAPFVDAPDGIAYVGDTGELNVRVNQGMVEAVNVPGNVLLGALSASIASRADLSPALTPETRLEDLAGAAGRGIRKGTLVISVQGAAGSFNVDLTPADTIGDVADLINQAAEEAGAGLTASVGGEGLVISPGGSPVVIDDLSTGAVAADLGIRTAQAASAEFSGTALRPRLTRLTPVEALAGGQGIDLEGGLTLTTGGQSVVVDLSEAATVQDIINAINNAGIFAVARINEAGTAIDLFNQVSGAALSITEHEGTTAEALGLKTMSRDVLLSGLNSGRGVGNVEGQADFAITGKDGVTTFEVNLDGAVTLGDVVDRINDAATEAAASIEAGIAPDGGILLADTGGGEGSVSVTPQNQSTAADDLGLTTGARTESGDLLGLDVNAARAEGVLDALLALERALRADDDQGISAAGERISSSVQEVIRVHGTVGARSREMQSRLDLSQDAILGTKALLSQARDLDFTDAITRLQAAQMVLQASLLTSSQLQNLSLLDYLR